MPFAYLIACAAASTWLVAIFRPDAATRRECVLVAGALTLVTWLVGLVVAPGLR